MAYTNNGGRFLLTKPIDGKEATGANSGTIGFSLSSDDQAAAWHKAGVEHGGTAIEDPPANVGAAAATCISPTSASDFRMMTRVGRIWKSCVGRKVQYSHTEIRFK